MNVLSFIINVKDDIAAGLSRTKQALQNLAPSFGASGKDAGEAFNKGAEIITPKTKHIAKEAISTFANTKNAIASLFAGDWIGAGQSGARAFVGLSSGLRAAIMGPLGLVGAAFAAVLGGIKVREILQEKFNIRIGIPNLDVPEAPFKKWRDDADALNKALTDIDKIKYDKLKESIKTVADAFDRAATAAREFYAAQSNLAEANDALNIAKINADPSLSPQEKEKRTAQAQERAVGSKALMDTGTIDAEERNLKIKRDYLQKQIKDADDAVKEARRKQEVSTVNRGAYREQYERAAAFAAETKKVNSPELEKINSSLSNIPTSREAVAANSEAAKLQIQNEAKLKAEQDKARRDKVIADANAEKESYLNSKKTEDDRLKLVQDRIEKTRIAIGKEPDGEKKASLINTQVDQLKERDAINREVEDKKKTAEDRRKSLMDSDRELRDMTLTPEQRMKESKSRERDIVKQLETEKDPDKRFELEMELREEKKTQKKIEQEKDNKTERSISLGEMNDRGRAMDRKKNPQEEANDLLRKMSDTLTNIEKKKGGMEP